MIFVFVITLTSEKYLSETISAAQVLFVNAIWLRFWLRFNCIYSDSTFPNSILLPFINRIDKPFSGIFEKIGKRKDGFEKPSCLVAGAGFEPTTFGLWARRATELLYPAIYNSAVFYSFIIIALCKGCVNSFLHIFLFYALPGFFDWIYLHFNLSFFKGMYTIVWRNRCK